MVLIGLTDIHGDTRAVDAIGEQLARADLVIIAGDLTHFGGRTALLRVLDALRAYANAILAVPGNCDNPEVGTVLDTMGLSLDARNRTIDSIAFWGAGGAMPGSKWTPSECNDSVLSTRLESAARGVQPPSILVVHHPPLNTGADREPGRLHVGSSAVRTCIEKHSPMLCFTGHIHGARGISTLGSTTVVNPGPFKDGFFAKVEVEGNHAHVTLHG